VAILLYFVNLQDVAKILQQVHYGFLFPVFILYVLGLVARAMAWRTLLQEEVSTSRVFLILNAGYLMNNILPFRLGEFGRAFLMGRKGLGFWRVFPTILIERAFDLALVAGMVLYSLPYAFGGPQARPIALGVVVLVLAGLAALHLLARYQDWVLEKIDRFSARWPYLQRMGQQQLRSFTSGLAALMQVRRFLMVLIWMLVTWSLALGAQYLLLLAFLPDARFLWALFGQGIVALGVAIPSSPAYIGVVEAAWVGALSLFGVSTSIGLAYALASHLLNIGVTGVFGAIALVREGESLGHLYRRLRDGAPKFYRGNNGIDSK